MVKCDKCGKEVLRLTGHAKTREKLCLQCISKSGFFSFTDDNIITDNEKRRNIRVPLTIVMGFYVHDGDTPHRKHHSLSVNISMSGICFAWDACSSCKGYFENGIHEECIFSIYDIRNPNRKELRLELELTETYKMEVNAHAVYTLKEKEFNQEYIGVQFINVSNKDNLMLEQIICEYGPNR